MLNANRWAQSLAQHGTVLHSTALESKETAWHGKAQHSLEKPTVIQLAKLIQERESKRWWYGTILSTVNF